MAGTHCHWCIIDCDGTPTNSELNIMKKYFFSDIFSLKEDLIQKSLFALYTDQKMTVNTGKSHISR